MATEDKFFSATLGGIPLRCQTTEDGFEKAISKQEIPYTNGGNTDDQGMRIPTIGLHCFFFDENYDDHKKLIDILKAFDLLELVHPVYGLQKVRVERMVVRHDDNADSAEIDLSLVVDGTPQVQIKAWASIKDQAEKEYTASVAEQKQSILQKILSLGTKGEAFCETAIEKFGGIMIDITNPANTLASLVDYGTDLPGRFVEAAALCVERYAIAYNALRNAPAAFHAQLAASLKDLNAQFDKFDAQVDAASAARQAVEAATSYDKDEQLRAKNKVADKVKGFTVEGKRVSISTDDSLNSVEIENILALTNTAIQTALEGDRGNTALMRMAADLYTAAVELKKSAENVKKVRINNPTHIHLICLQYGLPYTAAPHLLAMNPQIMDPNRVSGEILIYA